MIKKQASKRKPFSLTEFTKGKVKRLTLHIEDINISDSKESETKSKTAVISGTLYIYKDKIQDLKPGEDNFETLNFMLPLQANADFKKHVLSIIHSALELDRTRVVKN